jgi:hypothetical protein
MSDERLSLPEMSVDAVDECAPTERDPSRLVLWGLDGLDAEETHESGAIDVVRARAHD